MTHKSYIYDTERRYSAALMEGFTDSVMKEMYLEFSLAKKRLEAADGELNAIRSLTRCGQPEDRNASLQALRRCNGAECDLSVLSRRISMRILQLRRNAQGMRLST